VPSRPHSGGERLLPPAVLGSFVALAQTGKQDASGS
jgi:hypothetical protein